MMRRCSDSRVKQFKDYGGRGIKVCERWSGESGFENFVRDMGPKPTPRHTLDRYPNNDGDYDPGNCRWATRLEQGSNQRSNRIIEHNGTRATMSEWARKIGIPWQCICWRLNAGWPVSRALETPSKRGGGKPRFTRSEADSVLSRLASGETIRGLSRELGISRQILKAIRDGRYVAGIDIAGVRVKETR